MQYGRRVAAMKLWDPERATPEHLFCVAFLTTIVVAKEPKTQGPHLNEKIWFEKLVENHFSFGLHQGVSISELAYTKKKFKSG